jgi:acyl-coenzyme A thioesterase PaaI-like protein
MNLRQLIWNTPWLSDVQRIKWFPPFWLLRITVLELSPCWRTVRILLPHNWISTNSGGSLFGGFQACLADPIAAMSCHKVFSGYSVWTRSLHLDFRTEALTGIELHFTMTATQEAEIRAELQAYGRSTPDFEYGYFLSDGALCTLVRAKVAIRPVGYKKRRNKRVSLQS